MFRRTLGLIGAALLTATGLAEASGPATLANAKVVDPTTGAIITTRAGVPGTAAFEIATSRVTIHKDVLLGRSVTTIAAGGDRLAITIDRTTVGVATRTSSASASLTHPEGIERIIRVLQDSRAASEAATLLGRLRLDSRTGAGQTFAFTKALLQSVEGSREGTMDLVTSARPTTTGTHVVEARVGPSPGDCWNLYAKDAIRVANEYVDCYNSTSWYDVLGLMGCGALYDVQAEGDWLWYLNCVGSPLPQVRVG
jgi:hypothetical protein